MLFDDDSIGRSNDQLGKYTGHAAASALLSVACSTVVPNSELGNTAK